MKRRLDNNSKFLFTVSSCLIILFIIIFVSNMINQDTYSATDECNIINGKCCMTKTQRWSSSPSPYSSLTVAQEACDAKEASGDFECITAYESDSGKGKWRYISTPYGRSGYDYKDKTAAMSACYDLGSSICDAEQEVVIEYKYRYYEYSDCSSIQYNTCVKINDNSDTYKLCYNDTDECLSNIFPNKITCESVRDSGDDLSNCETFDGANFYRGQAIFKYNGETLYEKHCNGNGSHCYITDVPEFSCPDNKTFVGWVYDESDCGTNINNYIIPGEDEVTLFIGPSVMECGETKSRDVYACCELPEQPSSSSPSSSSKPSSSSSSSSKPSSSLPSSKPSSSSPSSSKPSSFSSSKPSLASSSSVASSSKPSSSFPSSSKPSSSLLSSRPSSSSSSSSKPSSVPSSKSSLVSSSSVTSSSKLSSSLQSSSYVEPLPPDNPDTGNVFVYMVLVIGLIMVGYSVWYFKKYN